MGRAFECRKTTKLKRWENMARTFTRFGRKITIAVKEGGADPNTNSRLRILIQQSKKENIPKENIKRAIEKAISKEVINYKEITYEGYGPFGIAVAVETATDNPTRTVANMRSYFNQHGGSLGTNGSVQFLFAHKCMFEVLVKKETELEELELELIDFGVTDIKYGKKKNTISIYGEAQSFLEIQKYLEKNYYEIHQAEFERIPIKYKEVTENQRIILEKLFNKFEEDRDVQNIFHNMKTYSQ